MESLTGMVEGTASTGNMGREQTTRAPGELVTEKLAGFCLHKVGLDADVKNEAAYIQSWIQAFMNEKKAVLWASSEAKKAVWYQGIFMYAEPLHSCRD